ncbi:MAG: hypothetical protein ACTSUJ_08900 [Candidatus Njordarchaeales archaeon]
MRKSVALILIPLLLLSLLSPPPPMSVRADVADYVGSWFLYNVTTIRPEGTILWIRNLTVLGANATHVTIKIIWNYTSESVVAINRDSPIFDFWLNITKYVEFLRERNGTTEPVPVEIFIINVNDTVLHFVKKLYLMNEIWVAEILFRVDPETYIVQYSSCTLWYEYYNVSIQSTLICRNISRLIEYHIPSAEEIAETISAPRISWLPILAIAVIIAVIVAVIIIMRKRGIIRR